MNSPYNSWARCAQCCDLQVVACALVFAAGCLIISVQLIEAMPQDLDLFWMRWKQANLVQLACGGPTSLGCLCI